MAPKNALSLDMLIRKMPYGPRRTICRMMDVGDWEALPAAIINPRTGEPRYSLDDIANFRLELRRGNSMTEAVLRDWGTQETNIEQLFDILLQIGRQDIIQEVMPEYLKQILEQELHNPHDEYVGQHGEPPVDKNVESNTATGNSIESRLKNVTINSGTNKTTEQFQGATAASKSETQQIMKDASAEGVMDICYISLKVITANFNETRKLGEGGFGAVYSGRLPKNGENVAVKVLKQTEDSHKGQFKNELKHLSSLKHKNILPPMGFSFDGPSYCLVYKLMPNGSLEDCLKNSSKKCIPWKLRLSIATDIALGISYLHSKKIVHRDIKSANVLLDENFVGKVADFGLVRNIGKDNKTHVTKIIIGSPVYMCREAFQGDVSPSVDVYSYGVILLEIITGLPASEVPKTQEDIVTYCQSRVEDCKDELYSMVDKTMEDYVSEEIDGVYALADKCLEDRKVRRISMEKLLSEIKRISKYEE